MELYTMQYVLALADSGSFSLAAQACHVGQPALSQQISRLEKQLGVPLFYRTTRGVILTEAGTEFVQHAREIVQHAESLKEEMALYGGIRRGSLNMGIITSLQCINFGEMLSAFCSSYPEISVNIVQQGTHGLLDLLQERKVDLAFINRPITGISSLLEFVKLGEDYYSLAVSRLHPFSKRGVISLTELKNERFIFHQTGQAAAALCLEACQKAGFVPNIVCRSGSPTIGLYMVRGGLGVAFLPSEEFRSHTVDGIVELKLKEHIVKEVGVAWRRDTVSPLVKTAVQFAKEWSR